MDVRIDDAGVAAAEAVHDEAAAGGCRRHTTPPYAAPRRCHKLLQEQCRGGKVDEVGGRLRLGVVVASLAEAAPQYVVYLRR